MEKLLIICGLTATGKTSLGIALAKRFNGEIVSADSRQVYRTLDIISGKELPKGSRGQVSGITLTIRKKEYRLGIHTIDTVPVWLYDVVEPHESFSVAQYKKLAARAIADIRTRGKLPIVVGGTGLYIRGIAAPFDTIDIPQNEKLRRRLSSVRTPGLQRELQRTDTRKWESMKVSDRANPRRLIRAIEVGLWRQEHTGEQKRQQQPLVDVLWVGLREPMAMLTLKISARVRSRWHSGAVEEARSILRHVGSPLLQSATALGIDPLRKYLAGQLTEEQASEAWVKEEVRYAKRQMTWFRKEERIRWYDTREKDFVKGIEQVVREWYT